MKIKSFVGNHDINIYHGCSYDPTLRKYRGGTLLKTISYSGKMLNAESVQKSGWMIVDGVKIPVTSRQMFINVDPIPPLEECDYCIVSNKYVAACKNLGINTSRLLTIGDTVVDSDGRIIGCVGLCKN